MVCYLNGIIRIVIKRNIPEYLMSNSFAGAALRIQSTVGFFRSTPGFEKPFLLQVVYILHHVALVLSDRELTEI